MHKGTIVDFGRISKRAKETTRNMSTVRRVPHGMSGNSETLAKDTCQNMSTDAQGANGISRNSETYPKLILFCPKEINFGSKILLSGIPQDRKNITKR